MANSNNPQHHNSQQQKPQNQPSSSQLQQNQTSQQAQTLPPQNNKLQELETENTRLTRELHERTLELSTKENDIRELQHNLSAAIHKKPVGSVDSLVAAFPDTSTTNDWNRTIVAGIVDVLAKKRSLFDVRLSLYNMFEGYTEAEKEEIRKALILTQLKNIVESLMLDINSVVTRR